MRSRQRTKMSGGRISSLLISKYILKNNWWQLPQQKQHLRPPQVLERWGALLLPLLSHFCLLQLLCNGGAHPMPRTAKMTPMTRPWGAVNRVSAVLSESLHLMQAALCQQLASQLEETGFGWTSVCAPVSTTSTLATTCSSLPILPWKIFTHCCKCLVRHGRILLRFEMWHPNSLSNLFPARVLKQRRLLQKKMPSTLSASLWSSS